MAPRPGPTQHAMAPELGCLRSNNNRVGTQPYPSADRLPLNALFGMALPTRKPRTTSGKAPVSPTQKYATSPWTKTHKGADTRSEKDTVLQHVKVSLKNTSQNLS